MNVLVTIQQLPGERIPARGFKIKVVKYGLLAVMFLLLAGTRAALAGPLEDGESARQRGDRATALKLWLPLARQGNAEAQARVGLLYSNLDAPDRAAAAAWTRLAARQGHAEAQATLAALYEGGAGVPRDLVRAYMWRSVWGARQTGENAKTAAILRDMLAGRMTAAQSNEAQDLAKACAASNYRQCGEPEVDASKLAGAPVLAAAAAASAAAAAPKAVPRAPAQSPAQKPPKKKKKKPAPAKA